MNDSMDVHLEEIDVFLTEGCNLQCRFCAVDACPPDSPFIPLETIRRVMDQGIPLGLQELHLTGGEPTLHPQLEDIVREVTKKGLNTRLISNGLLLSKAKLQSLWDAGLRQIMISLDGLEGSHDDLRGRRGSWKAAKEAVKNALAMGYITRVNAVGLGSNIQEIAPLAVLCAELGVSIFSVFLGSPLGRASEDMENILRQEQWLDFHREMAKGMEAGVFGEEMEILLEQGYIPQGAPEYDLAQIKGRGAGCASIGAKHDYLILRPNGDLFPCIFTIHQGESLGNVNAGSIEEILSHPVKKDDYSQLRNYETICPSCELIQSCRAGCRGYAKIYFHDWSQADPRCDKASGAYPVCPIAKRNLRRGTVSGSSEQALKD